MVYILFHFNENCRFKFQKFNLTVFGTISYNSKSYNSDQIIVYSDNSVLYNCYQIITAWLIAISNKSVFK